LRFGKGSKVADNLYVRQDGTLSYYFALEDLIYTCEGITIEGEGEGHGGTGTGAGTSGETVTVSCSVLFYPMPFYSILFYSILFY
jgi:hypothetical protein